jgi:hypothetical protein
VSTRAPELPIRAAREDAIVAIIWRLRQRGIAF